MFNEKYSPPRGYEYPPPSGKTGILPLAGKPNPQPLSPENAQKVRDAVRKLERNDPSHAAGKGRRSG